MKRSYCPQLPKDEYNHQDVVAGVSVILPEDEHSQLPSKLYLTRDDTIHFHPDDLGLSNKYFSLTDYADLKG
jgi:hypothetical protein